MTDASPIPLVAAVPAGTFRMGENPDDRFANDTERPAHPVRIARPFALGRFPVTVGEYRAFDAGHAPDEAPSLPVAGVTWDEAKAYCAWLAQETGDPWRLPSEAEWEYACRAGSGAPFAWGDAIGAERANFLYEEDGSRTGRGARSPRGSNPANAFGLEDMHGNVCEWTEDRWHPDYRGAPADGSPWSEGGDPHRRVIRGGAWDYLPRLLRSSWRDSLGRSERRDNVGFRAARTLP